MVVLLVQVVDTIPNLKIYEPIKHTHSPIDDSPVGVMGTHTCSLQDLIDESPAGVMETHIQPVCLSLQPVTH